MFVRTFERDEFFLGFVVKYKLMELLAAVNFLKKFFAIMFEGVVADEGLLDGLVLFCDEFSDRHRHAFLF